MKTIEIIGGGTVSHVRNHLALAAPAYGNTARAIHRYLYLQETYDLLKLQGNSYSKNLYLTKMASSGESNLETNEDISNLVDKLIANQDTKIIFFNPALVDYNGYVTTKSSYSFAGNTKSGKYEPRLKTSDGPVDLYLFPADKIVSRIRKHRKDIFLVAFKTTCGATEDEQFIAGLNLLKTASCNLVLANDTKTRVNMIITPEQARYSVSTDRDSVLADLVIMALQRSNNTFTRSTVVDGDPVNWNDNQVPASLRKVVDHCISKGAYKPFNGVTVGHFAAKLDNKTFLTSRRKTNFNNLDSVGLVKIESSGPNSVIAHGSKPSVGGQSQRIIFNEHPETDCIVHFHCKPKPNATLSVKSQMYFECGSHECGKNTSSGLREEGDDIKCVYLDKHGPNIVFNKDIDPQRVIDFIDKTFDLSSSTDEIVR